MATGARTQQRILEATLRLIARGGVDAVRYRDVAAAARAPLGTVSYRYPAREDLIRAAFAWFLERNAASLLRLGAKFEARALADVARFLTEALRVDFGDPRRGYLAEYELLVYAGRDPVIAAALADWDRAMAAELARALEGLGLAGPLLAAETLIDLLRGFQLANLGRKDPDLESFRARVSRVLAALAHHAPHPPAPSRDRARPAPGARGKKKSRSGGIRDRRPKAR